MIISTGMRTDIPAFYSKWFVERIKDGFVYVRNPYNQSNVTKYLLLPNVVDCICFCTKNPLPMLPYMDLLSKFKQFWFVSITAYGKDYEPFVPEKSKIIDAFKQLSAVVGKNAIGWRYDPIFYGDGYDEQRHVQTFTKIATALNGYTNQCVISFLDMYQKVKESAPKIYTPTQAEQIVLVKKLVDIAKQNGICLKSCCEGTHLAPFGVDVSGCQTKQVIELAIGEKLVVPTQKNARVICNCLLGHDIGAYNTCGHLCKYCYANANADVVKRNIKMHNPSSPFLIGELKDGDKINNAKQTSYITRQTSLLDAD